MKETEKNKGREREESGRCQAHGVYACVCVYRVSRIGNRCFERLLPLCIHVCLISGKRATLAIFIISEERFSIFFFLFFSFFWILKFDFAPFSFSERYMIPRAIFDQFVSHVLKCYENVIRSIVGSYNLFEWYSLEIYNVIRWNIVKEIHSGGNFYFVIADSLSIRGYCVPVIYRLDYIII